MRQPSNPLFFLVYGLDPRLPCDDNPLRPLASETDSESLHARLGKLTTIRRSANKALLAKAIAQRQLKDDKAMLHTLEEGSSVLLQNEAKTNSRLNAKDRTKS